MGLVGPGDPLDVYPDDRGGLAGRIGQRVGTAAGRSGNHRGSNNCQPGNDCSGVCCQRDGSVGWQERLGPGQRRGIDHCRHRADFRGRLPDGPSPGQPVSARTAGVGAVRFGRAVGRALLRDVDVQWRLGRDSEVGRGDVPGLVGSLHDRVGSMEQRGGGRWSRRRPRQTTRPAR